MARIGLHLPNVTGIDRTVNYYVRPEVARADCYARLRLHKANIARIYAAIACPAESPISTPIGTKTSPVLVPSFTFASVTPSL